MSYSFGVLARSKDEAKSAVSEEFDKVAAAQPNHAHDRDQAVAAAHAFIDLLEDDDTRDVKVTVNGWVQWEGGRVDDPAPRYTGSSVSVTASLAGRLTPA